MDDDLFVDNDHEQLALIFIVHVLQKMREKVLGKKWEERQYGRHLKSRNDSVADDAITLYWAERYEKILRGRTHSWLRDLFVPNIGAICHCNAVLLESIAVVMEMLSDNQQSDVLEAVLFMVACAERKIISRHGDNDCRDEEAVKRLIEVLLSADLKRCITFEKALRRKIWMILFIGWVGQVCPRYPTVSCTFQRDDIYHDCW
ncbi:hypothetical protein TTRE_0000400601 [Trichuris trichiura]|uniref:Uncharacterized protein n=1 Tax=Trichuris trichiura TaxID=36087 RepID=A0A077Z7Z5_TRITR|nr:hypothetical protein TTRE_0000400601 [Trichuris trichiura]